MKVTEETVCVFETWSGSRYEINHGKVRRLSPDYEKRGDGKWHKLYNLPEIEVGQSAYLMMEPLSHLGADDYGTEGGALTTRITSEVVGIEVLSGEEVAW